MTFSISVITAFLKIVTAFLPNVSAPSVTINKCGLDKSPIQVVYEGDARIETYPWIGILFYKSDKIYSTPVVLVSQEFVISSALDIDRLPKTDFRSRARVVLGHNCSRPGFKVKDYAYHSEYSKLTYSSVALIQLEITFRTKDVQPVCPSPKSLIKPQFYVFALSDDCKKSRIKIYKMAYLSPDDCKTYYRRTERDNVQYITWEKAQLHHQSILEYLGIALSLMMALCKILDIEKMWPTHTICARAVTGKECIWRNGVILLLRQENKWSLIGLGIQGPGCRAPARFLDYVQHRSWLRNSVDEIGKPTVTRLSRNHLILRRSRSNIPRYGPCDPEEIKDELYIYKTTVQRYPTKRLQRAHYNFTIFANLEYTCVVFRVYYYNYPRIIRDIPYIQLNRGRVSKVPICYSFGYPQIDFSVTIWFRESVTYHVAAYGKEEKVIDMKKLMVLVNSKKPLVDVHEQWSQYRLR